MMQKRGNLFVNPITILVCLILMVATFYFLVFRTDAVRPPCKISSPFSCDEVGFRVVNNSVISVLINMTYWEGGYGGIIYSVRPTGGELALSDCISDIIMRVGVGRMVQYELKCRYPLQPDRIDSEFSVEYDKLDIGEMPLGVRHTTKGSLRIVDLGVVLKKVNQTNALSLNT